MNKKSGFTIIELTIVVVIIGVLAAIALPSYRIQMLKMQNQEAVRILMAVWEAQKEYRRENGNYYTGNIAGINANLDITIPPLKNFTSLYAANSTMGCIGSPQRYLARLWDNDSSYQLKILEDGRIICYPCSLEICKKMGFKADW